MELIYRGIKYSSNNSTVLGSAKGNKPQIVYRGKSVKTAIAPKFPVFKYCKQLFSSWKPPVFNPVKFWYKHKTQYLEKCWQLDEIEQLDCCWEITLKIEREQILKTDRPIKLKYRGVTYYR